MTSDVLKWSVTAVSAAALGLAPVALAPSAAAAPCADPAMCQAPAPGDAELHSAPNAAVEPAVPDAEQPPWQVRGAPGENRNP